MLNPVRLTRHVLRVAVVVVVAFFATTECIAWTVKSRELVDVQITANGTLLILVSAPGTATPGLYAWNADATAPSPMCAIDSPSSFSFDRRTVIVRVSAESAAVRLHDAATCSPFGQIGTTGRIIDADVHGGMVAIAVERPGEARSLELYTRRNTPIGSAIIGRNVELGFAPDGLSVFNFDLSDGAAAAWRIRSLSPVALPRWMSRGEVTFIAGSHYVQQYAEGTVSIVRWSTGKTSHSMPLPRTVRVRQLSIDGRYGVIHERLPRGDIVEWIDFAAGIRVKLDEGSIDHAAISPDGMKVAWTRRAGLPDDEVTVERATLSASGIRTPAK